MSPATPSAFEYSLEVTYRYPQADGEHRTLGGGVGNLMTDDDEIRAVFAIWQDCHVGCQATRVVLVRITGDGVKETIRSVDWVIHAN